MKVGIIAPIKFLDRYCITNVQYCLPKLLVGSEVYQDFYRARQKRGDIIILDCKKPGWKREPEDFDTVELALSMVLPSIIVAPSYMFNSKESERVYQEFIEEFAVWEDRIVRCLEGISEKEVKKPKGITAVPSHIYKYLLREKWKPDTLFIENDKKVDELDGRKGILVTSLPLKLGLQGRLLSDYKPAPNSLTFFEEEDNYPKVTMKNIMDTIEYYKEDK